MKVGGWVVCEGSETVLPNARASLLIEQTSCTFSKDMDFADALYFSMVTLSTVGLGDFYPVTHIGVILLILFSMVGLGIIGMTISVVRYDIKEI